LHGFLNPNDPVAISFWIISISMVAATVFFLMESTSVGTEWKTSLNVGALVTLVAAVHYFYMREFWIIIGTSPILYRYIDWSITVPLQMVEFYFILSAVNDKIGSGMFFRLFCGTVMMLAFGYAGESHFLNAWLAFALGMAGWAFILYEVFAGEAGKEAGNASGHVQSFASGSALRGQSSGSARAAMTGALQHSWAEAQQRCSRWDRVSRRHPERWQPADQLNWIDIMSDDHKLCLLFLDECRDVIQAILNHLRLFCLILSTLLLLVCHLHQSRLLCLFVLWLILL